jgi:hypothetical protein
MKRQVCYGVHGAPHRPRNAGSKLPSLWQWRAEMAGGCCHERGHQAWGLSADAIGGGHVDSLSLDPASDSCWQAWARDRAPHWVPVAAHVLVQKASWKGRGGAWRSASSLHAPLRHNDMGSIKHKGCTVFGLRRHWLRFEQPRVAAPSGPSPKVWPPCSFSNKEPSKTTVWLPCSGHVQEQKKLPPRLDDKSNCILRGSRQ